MAASDRPATEIIPGMKQRVLVVKAERCPMPGLARRGPHQIYRRPRVEVEERELGPLHPDEVRVRMIYAGVCGTDAHLVQVDPATGYILSSAPASIPPEGRVIGHEGVGEVLEVGERVRHAHRGEVVTFESIVVCHYCDVCRRGQFNQCRRARLLGLQKDGLFGDIVDVPSLLTHNVSDLAASDAGLRAAACVEPAGVAYVACQNARISGGDVVAIFGAGPIGLFAAELSKSIFGAAEVHLIEPVAFRRTVAERRFRHVHTPEAFFENPPRGLDAVLEASGCMDNIDRVFRRINPNGRVVLLARSGAPLTLTAVDHLITNAVELAGSRGHLCGAFSRVLGLYRGDRFPLGACVTHVVDGLDALAECLRRPRALIEENVKVLVRLGAVPGPR